MLLRWGICGCGFVSGDFTTALSLLPPSENKVVAAAASSLERAEGFTKKHNLSDAKAFGSYQELFNCEDVDVVYIGLLNHQHKDAVVSALKAGKHVLCEKPMGLNKKEVEDMIATAKQQKRFLMEGFWSRFFPAYKKVEEEIRNGVIGTPKVLLANFGYTMHESKAPRLFRREVGGGCGADIGVYCLQLALFLFKNELPHTIVATGKLFPGKGVDDNACITLQFSGNRVAQLMYSGSHNLPNHAVIIGEKEGDDRGECRKITFPENFWCPTEVETDNGRFFFPLPEGSGELEWTYPNSAGFSYEAQCVHDCILEGKLECPSMDHEESLRLIEILDEIRRQLGVVYDQD